MQQETASGTHKNVDNVIAERDIEGKQGVRFVPVLVFQTPESMEELCARFLEKWEADRIDKLILMTYVYP